jgi:hypothetical protein
MKLVVSITVHKRPSAFGPIAEFIHSIFLFFPWFDVAQTYLFEKANKINSVYKMDLVEAICNWYG